jgi:hypothetical protein
MLIYWPIHSTKKKHSGQYKNSQVRVRATLAVPVNDGEDSEEGDGENELEEIETEAFDLSRSGRKNVCESAKHQQRHCLNL